MTQTDQQTPIAQRTSVETDTKPDELPTPADDHDRTRVDLSATQLVASALAAMTAAIIGAQLSVAGTVIGAAVGSMVAGVASALYSVSLQRTHRELRKTLAKAPLSPRRKVTGPGGVAAPSSPAAPESTEPAAVEHAARLNEPRRIWTKVLAGAAAAFVLAGVGITAIELVTGQSVSGGRGTTTVSQVGQASGSAAVQHPAPSDEPKAPEEVDPLPTQVPSPSEEPTTEVPEQASEEPTESEPTTGPTEEPTDDPLPAEDATEQPTEQPTGNDAEPTEEPTSGGDGADAGTDDTGSL